MREKPKLILPPATKLGQGYIFTGVCDSVNRGGMRGCCWGVALGGMVALEGVCMVAQGGHAWLLWEGCMAALGGVHGCSGGHVWLLWGACMVAPGGVCGCSGGACMVAPRGHAWLLHGGMHGCSWGACVVALGGHAWLL